MDHLYAALMIIVFYNFTFICKLLGWGVIIVFAAIFKVCEKVYDKIKHQYWLRTRGQPPAGWRWKTAADRAENPMQFGWLVYCGTKEQP